MSAEIKDENITVITLSNPPVNALGQTLRRHIIDSLQQAEQDPKCQAVLIYGSNHTFSAGADIKEFGLPPKAPSLPEVCQRVESFSKPVIVAIEGVALGGGMELSLAAHYRLAMPASKLGLPEVHLGLLPGAGGTQRMPRLIGISAALELILSGRHVPAQEALSLGLIDRLLDADKEVLTQGIAFAREIISSGCKVRKTCDETQYQTDKPANKAALQQARDNVARSARGLFSPGKIIDAVQASLDKPFAEGMRVEREYFLECLNSPQHKGLTHAFFAEREAAKPPQMHNAKPRDLKQIGIVGGGTMGVGIAISLLDGGFKVVMVERDEQALARGTANVEKVYDALIAKGRLNSGDKITRMAHLTGATHYAALAPVDLVIEAVFEEIAVKKALFMELDRVCKPGAVLASNTSYLNINQIAAVTSRPKDVIGLHFFSPANIMKLLEIVVGEHTSDDVVATGFALAKRLKKQPVRAGVCDGFIGNRILGVYRTAADYMMEDGASPYQIDQAVRHFGYPMGPYQVSDLAGGDIGWATRKSHAATRDPKRRYVRIADALCERGWFGQKTSHGYYLYNHDKRKGEVDPDVLAIISEERRKAGIQPRTFTEEEILRRYLAAMINEGANVVQEGIASRPLDVDVVLLSGYGFPRYRGGPMKYADIVGLPKILADINEFAKEDPLFWQPSPLLVSLVAQGADFESLNRSATSAHSPTSKRS